MAGDDPAGQPEAGIARQQRALARAERALLYRVLGMVDGGPGYAQVTMPGLRDALGDGRQPQQRDLAEQERAGLGNLIRVILEEWFGPRLFRDPDPAWELSRTDVARLGAIWRAVAPPPTTRTTPCSSTRPAGPARQKSRTTG